VWDDRIRCDSCEKSYVAVEMDRDPSRGHRPICASCATGQAFRRSALAESPAGSGRRRTTARLLAGRLTVDRQ
jgi:hypothetical protein